MTIKMARSKIARNTQVIHLKNRHEQFNRDLQLSRVARSLPAGRGNEDAFYEGANYLYMGYVHTSYAMVSSGIL